MMTLSVDPADPFDDNAKTMPDFGDDLCDAVLHEAPNLEDDALIEYAITCQKDRAHHRLLIGAIEAPELRLDAPKWAFSSTK